jgi:hypothetical protein
MSKDNQRRGSREGVRVRLTYHPTRQPPDATGPGDIGVFRAAIDDGAREPGGWGRSEEDAIGDLASKLKQMVAGSPLSGGLTIFGKACDAARQMSATDFEDWLATRADQTILLEPSEDYYAVS